MNRRACPFAERISPYVGKGLGYVGVRVKLEVIKWEPDTCSMTFRVTVEPKSLVFETTIGDP